MSDILNDTKFKTEIVSSIEFQETNTKSKINFIINNFIELNEEIISEKFIIGSYSEWFIKVDTIFTENEINYLSVWLYLS